jgi:uncharacterized repeat protein (TIGR01451 family)
MTHSFNTPATKEISQESKMNDNTGARFMSRNINKLKLPLAVLLLMAGSITAYAAVTNSVTVTGTGPSGPPGSVTDTANESVDVEDDAPAIAVVRSFTLTNDVNGNGLVDAGDTIVYTYVVQNSGNVTLTDVSVSDVHDATGTPVTYITPTSVTTDNFVPGAGQQNDSSDVGSNNDGDWDVLGPNDYITFTSSPYVVLPGDILLTTSTSDNDIDGTVTASGTYDPGSAPVTASGSSSSPVPLNIAPSLEVAKVASQDTNVPAGTTVIYTYTVTNNGTVPITNITLSDTHKGVLDALTPAFVSFTTNTGSTNTGNTINVLQPGDVAEFTASYVVTQSDVDTLQ